MSSNSTELDTISHRLPSVPQGGNNAGSTSLVPKFLIGEAINYKEHEKERKEKEEKEEKMARISANASAFTAPAVYGSPFVNSA
ncbi:hypothetical protein BOTCAL_1585g00010 [Botryotinia calthae]|uniref:Uncharacterized protein n=1 Tax=Botryotinia calthae TaxID=38488 RepID=A0A4Y8CBA9_9HELO|nr:hypothetical protein BOTCAL_1585g00010 [Botryotinia calthae]